MTQLWGLLLRAAKMRGDMIPPVGSSSPHGCALGDNFGLVLSAPKDHLRKNQVAHLPRPNHRHQLVHNMTPINDKSPASTGYAGQRVALLTQHGKERVIGPVLDEALGCQVERVDGFDWAQAKTFAHQAGFPEHHLVLRPAGDGELRIRKGIATWPELKAAFAQTQAQAAQGQVLLENDLRAHAHPTRQDNIRRAAQDLAARLQSLCPACGTPGFWGVDLITGLPCGACGAPTRETRAEAYACLKCQHQQTRARSGPAFADPSRCDYCNP